MTERKTRYLGPAADNILIIDGPLDPKVLLCGRCDGMGLEGRLEVRHSPLCRDEDGKLTELTDGEIRRV